MEVVLNVALVWCMCMWWPRHCVAFLMDPYGLHCGCSILLQT